MSRSTRFAGFGLRPLSRAQKWLTASLPALVLAALLSPFSSTPPFYPLWPIEPVATPPDPARLQELEEIGILRKRIEAGLVQLANAGNTCRVIAPSSPVTGITGVTGTRPLSREELVRLAEQVTGFVFVDTPAGGLSAAGSGFFVSPDRFVTNRHVIENAQAQSDILILSKSLMRPRRASVIRVSETIEEGAPDFALLALGNSSHAGAVLGPRPEKLDRVIAAGYPVLGLPHDRGLRRFLSGDDTAAPDLNFSVGHVQSVQESARETSIISHSAELSHGNSGGPLFDRCGRVIGINTFVAVDTKSAGKINYALGTDALMNFLAAEGIVPASSDRRCGGGAGEP